MSSPAERLGQIVAGKYRLDALVGKGGMGAVYRATHTSVGKQFAVKLLHKDAVEHKDVVRRFFMEAQVAARVGHLGIVDVYDVGEEPDGTPFMVMELLAGEPLSARIERGPLPIDEAVSIALEILTPLEAAHAAGIVHRDIKPHNVFLLDASSPSASANGGRIVKLLDFGIAKLSEATAAGSALTRSGVLVGSPLYMSPEQVRAEPDVDARADLWSVGCVLYEMLVGKPPHAAPTTIAVLSKIAMEQAPPPSAARTDVPPAIDGIVGRALVIDRDGRWPSAGAMRDSLQAYRDGTTDTMVSTPPKGPPTATPVQGGYALRASAPAAGAAATPGASSASSASGGSGSGAAVAATPSSATPVAGVDSLPGTSSARPATGRSTRGLLIMGGAIVAATFLVLVGGKYASRWRGEEAPPAATAGGEAPAPPGPPTTATAAPPTASRSATPTAATATAATTAQAPATAPTATATATATATTMATTTSTANAASARPATSAGAGTPKPRCPAGEVASEGHCCPRGLVWQIDRCDRPLATSAPF